MTRTKKIVISISTIIILILAMTLNSNYKYSNKIKQGDSLVVSGKYYEAMTVYKEALKIKNNSEMKNKIDNTSNLEKSSDAFNIGMKDLDAKSYVTSFSSFESVIKKDSKNYAIAREKMQQCIKLENNNDIKLAKESASNKDYERAIQYMDCALGIDDTNKQIINLKTQYTKNKVDAEAKVIADAQVKAEADAKVQKAKEVKEAQIAQEAQEAQKAQDKIKQESVQKASEGEEQNISTTVYVTRTGAKYHSDGCRYLSRSKIEISLEDAERSYTPCSVCNPPQ